MPGVTTRYPTKPGACEEAANTKRSRPPKPVLEKLDAFPSLSEPRRRAAARLRCLRRMRRSWPRASTLSATSLPADSSGRSHWILCILFMLIVQSMKIALELESLNSNFSDQDIATPDEADLQDHPFLLKPACIHCFTTPSLRELPWGNQDIATADDEAKIHKRVSKKSIESETLSLRCWHLSRRAIVQDDSEPMCNVVLFDPIAGFCLFSAILGYANPDSEGKRYAFYSRGTLGRAHRTQIDLKGQTYAERCTRDHGNEGCRARLA